MEEENKEEDGAEETDDGKGSDFDYLLSMPMWNLTQEKKDNLCKNRDERNQELKKLQATSIKTMWRKDLDDFITKLDEVEKKENEDLAEAAANAAKMKKTAGKKGKGIKMEALPSAHAIRVDPIIADDLKAKASKAVAAKERKDKGEDKPKKVKKEVDEEVDEFDLMASDKALNKSLSQKLGTPTKEKVSFCKTFKGKNFSHVMCLQKKRAPKTSPGAKKGEKKKNPWSDSDASDVDGDLSDVMDDMEVAPRERATGGRRAAANKAKFKFVSLAIKIFSFSFFIQSISG